MKYKNKKKRTDFKGKSKIITYLLNCVITFSFMILLLLILTFICYKLNINKDSYYTIMLLIICLSSIVGGYRLAFLCKKNGILNGIIGSVPIIILIVIITVVFGNTITFKSIIPICISLFSSAFAGAFAVNIRR